MEDLESLKGNFKNSTWGATQLRKISIFDGLSDEELKQIYSLGTIKTVNAKANVIIEGEKSRGLFILLYGSVSVYKSDQVEGNMIRLAFLEKEAVFGELSLFDIAPRSATVVAENDCYLFVLEADSFEEYLNLEGDQIKTRFYKKCAQEMVERFRRQNGDYVIAQKLLWKYALRKSDDPNDMVEER